jgi:hypothetical protein
VGALALLGAALLLSGSVALAQMPADPSANIDKMASPSQILLDDFREYVQRTFDQGYPADQRGHLQRVLTLLEQADERGNRNGAVDLQEARSLSLMWFSDNPEEQAYGPAAFEYYMVVGRDIGSMNADMATWIDQQAEDLNPDVSDRGAPGPRIGNGDGRLSLSEINAFIADQQDRIASEGDLLNKYERAITWAEELKFYVTIDQTSA